MYMCPVHAQALTHVFVWGVQRFVQTFFLYGPPTSFERQGLSLNQDLGVSAGLAGQWASGICSIVPDVGAPRHWLFLGHGSSLCFHERAFYPLNPLSSPSWYLNILQTLSLGQVVSSIL